jgi:hypothetical protein
MMVRSSVSLCALLLAGSVASADELKSGPQVGEGINGGFGVQCVNGTCAGKRCCPV